MEREPFEHAEIGLQACGSCHYWRREGSRRAGWGQCRRMPPALPAVRTDKLKLVGVWPVTEERDWCGEWRAASGRAGPDAEPEAEPDQG
jgi:hypothetical protein